MKRELVSTALMIAFCLTSSLAFGEPRGRSGGNQGKETEKQGRGGEKPTNESRSGNKPPGGSWSEGKQSSSNSAHNREAGEKNQTQTAGPAAEQAHGKKKSDQSTGAEGAATGAAAATNRNNSTGSGAGGAAAGAAAANRNNPAASGAEGAAFGAAATNRNNSTVSGAGGAAAGAAAANRNNPAASGAEGAAFGAAATNRNNSTVSGAGGAAAGAAAVNRNNPAASGAEGAAFGAAAANRNQPAVSGAQAAFVGAAGSNRNQSANVTSGSVRGYATVQNSFDHPNLYSQQWHSDHPGAWSAGNWPAGTAWAATSMAGVASYCGYVNSMPIAYGYGTNVAYQNGNVIVNGQNVGTAQAFSQQAAELAQRGQDTDVAATDEWLPLGVFALVRNEDQHPQLTVQLAVDKEGIVRGNYTDLLTDHTLPINGAVDEKTQRVAWTVDNNNSFYMEAGLINLTSGEAPTLIHKHSRTEQWYLVRLQQPDGGSKIN